MTLKEKFYPYCDNEYFDKWVSAEYCEDVADDFAIGFAEWLNKNYIVTSDFLWLECDTMIKKNSKELLEKFKKK